MTSCILNVSKAPAQFFFICEVLRLNIESSCNGISGRAVINVYVQMIKIVK